MSIYELAILGSPSGTDRAALESAISRMIGDFGLSLGTDVVIHDGSTVGSRDKGAAFAGVYFGGVPHTDVDAARDISRASVPVIPSVAPGGSFGVDIPDFIQHTNGYKRRADDPELIELSCAMLECVGLLRQQRRVFISYRRTESRLAAMQLHDLMTSRGFDVFLDTHDIRPGEPFQEVLWHRLCDADVVVMLDTPAYFDSKWTRQEIGRARAKEIHVLRVVWPDHVPSRLTDMAETVYMDRDELEGPEGPIVEQTANQILLAVEELRSRSIASRHMSLTGRLRADVEKIGGAVDGVGAHRAISLRLEDGRRLWAYPVVGVPTAAALNEVADRARKAAQSGTPVLLYDHLGIRDSWAAHLSWLSQNITSVRSLKVSEAAWELAAWEN